MFDLSKLSLEELYQRAETLNEKIYLVSISKTSVDYSGLKEQTMRMLEETNREIFERESLEFAKETPPMESFIFGEQKKEEKVIKDRPWKRKK